MTNKKDRSYSEQVIKRILNSLYEYGPLRKLRLSLLSQTYFQGCMQYVSFMKRLQWINVTTKTTKKTTYDIITITEEGCNILDLLEKQDYDNEDLSDYKNDKENDKEESA